MVKWNWLDEEGFYATSLVDTKILAVPYAVISFIISYTACWLVQGAILGAEGPNALTWWIVLFLTVGIPVLMFWLPRLHYLHNMTSDQASALRWYNSLTKMERLQLPDGWDKLVIEQGDKRNVARSMAIAGRKVVDAYRAVNEQPEVPDHRIDLYMELMEGRQEELRQQLRINREIEDEIARMP